MASADDSAFARPVLALLKETFETPQGIFLDPNTSLLETLQGIPAEQASVPVGGGCASLAAQVAHLTFFIESFERHALEQDNSPVDWDRVWRTVEKVTPEEWDRLRAGLESAYRRMETLFRENPLWDEERIGGALSVVVHSAYHLGEIRQALCSLA